MVRQMPLIILLLTGLATEGFSDPSCSKIDLAYLEKTYTEGLRREFGINEPRALDPADLHKTTASRVRDLLTFAYFQYGEVTGGERGPEAIKGKIKSARNDEIRVFYQALESYGYQQLIVDPGGFSKPQGCFKLYCNEETPSF